MPSNDTLYHWFNELGMSRQALPYELVRVFSESENDALQDAIQFGFDHLERTLAFRFFIEEQQCDREQLWYDLVARLDDQSYYAALAIPLVRQVLEHRANFIGEKVSERCRLKDFNSFSSMHSNLQSIDRESVIEEAKLLASRFSRLEEEYRSLSSSLAFANWCKYFLNQSAQLLLLASTIHASDV